MASIGPHLDRATIAINREEFREAEIAARAALEIEPNEILALRILGLALRGQERFAEAVSALRAAVARRPGDAAIWADLGATHAKMREHREAFDALQRAASIDPSVPGVMINLGAVLDEEGHHEEAIKANRLALRYEPTSGLAHYNMANALRELKRLEEAAAHYEAAMRYKPDYLRAAYNLGLCRLLLGQYRDGWAGYEHRATVGEVVLDNYPQPRWDGAPLDGKSLVVHAEQGIGDEVLFASCVPELIGRARHLALVCEPRLASLFGRSFPGVEIVPFQRVVTRAPAPLRNAFDLQIAAGSLPRFLRPERSSFPSRPGFLIADPKQLEQWRERFASLGPGLKVGLSWRAGGKAVERRKRSMPLVDWRPILECPGVHFVNLQYSDTSAEVAAAQSQLGVRIHDWEQGDPLVDMDGFAAKIDALDLVISVGNATVHLAGALGTPAWALLPLIPSWRWRADGDDNPWYASVSLIRQTTLDEWGPQIDRAADMLYARVGAQRAATRSLATETKVGESSRPAAVSRTAAPAAPSRWLQRADLLGHDVGEFLKRRLDAAHESFRNHAWSAAEDALREVLQVAPRHARALTQLGWVAWKTDRLDLAIQSFRRALSMNDSDHELHYHLAAVLALAGRYLDAAPHYRRVIELKPRFRAAHLELGLAWQRAGEHAAALEPFRQAQSLAPSEFDAFLHEGRSLMALARVDAARRAFARALELEPQCAAAWAELAENLLGDQELTLAESCLRRARAIEPRAAQHIAALARTLAAAGRDGEAMGLLKRAIAAIPEEATLLRDAALVQGQRGAHHESESLLRRAIHLDPDDAGLHHALGAALAEQSRLPEALAAYDRALALEPARLETRRARALVVLGLGRLREGWRELAACDSATAPAPREIPSWDGSPLGGKTLWIRATGRLTDQLLCATTFDELIAEAGHCVIECDERFMPLFARAFPRATVAPLHVLEQTLGKRPPRPVDLQTTALELMPNLRGDGVRFLRRQPGFVPDPRRRRRFERRLAALPAGPRIGVFRSASVDGSAHAAATWRDVFTVLGEARGAWASSERVKPDSAPQGAPRVDLSKSVARLIGDFDLQAKFRGEPQFVDLSMPFDVPPLELHRTLTPVKGPRAADGFAAEALAVGEMHGFDALAPRADWEDIVALVASLDLVIAEDGPLWALAGLLGVRVWALCPAAPLAPRWLADADDQSLWRRNVQLIRPQRLSELVKPRHEKTSSAPGRAVDLSVMGGPVGPHWPVVATVPSSR